MTGAVFVDVAAPHVHLILACKAKLGLEQFNLPALVHTYASMRFCIVDIDFNGTMARKELEGRRRISSMRC